MAEPKLCKANTAGRGQPERLCGQPVWPGCLAACHEHRLTMVRSKTPGIFMRGSRWVVVWRYRGKQQRASFETTPGVDDAQEILGVAFRAHHE